MCTFLLVFYASRSHIARSLFSDTPETKTISTVNNSLVYNVSINFYYLSVPQYMRRIFYIDLIKFCCTNQIRQVKNIRKVIR